MKKSLLFLTLSLLATACVTPATVEALVSQRLTEANQEISLALDDLEAGTLSRDEFDDELEDIREFTARTAGIEARGAANSALGSIPTSPVELALWVGGLLAAGTFTTNTVRDRRRKKRGEAV